MTCPPVKLAAFSVLATEPSGAAALDVSAWPVEKTESVSGPTESNEPPASPGALDWTDPGEWR